MPVQGRTGLVYLSCPGAIVSYQNGSVWQVAQPGILPSPINPPSGSARSSLVDHIWLRQFGLIALSAVRSVAISTASGRRIVLDDNRAKMLLAAANLDEPLLEEGVPAAILTGKLEITVKKNKTTESIVLLVYNDRLLQHEADPTTYNLGSPAFQSEFRMLLAQ